MQSAQKNVDRTVTVAVNPPEVVNGHVATRRQGELHKHCRECTKLIIADIRKLRRHYRGHHQGKNPQFLKPDDEVEFTVYKNFKAYWMD
jgi:cyclopropane fatty-acyl-phospholipid synthase-like methyltransferase